MLVYLWHFITKSCQGLILNLFSRQGCSNTHLQEQNKITSILKISILEQSHSTTITKFSYNFNDGQTIQGFQSLDNKVHNTFY